MKRLKVLTSGDWNNPDKTLGIIELINQFYLDCDKGDGRDFSLLFQSCSDSLYDLYIGLNVSRFSNLKWLWLFQTINLWWLKYPWQSVKHQCINQSCFSCLIKYLRPTCISWQLSWWLWSRQQQLRLAFQAHARMADYASSLTSVIVQVVGVEKNATVYQYKGALLHV